MSVFRGDSDNGIGKETQEGREASEAGAVNGAEGMVNGAKGISEAAGNVPASAMRPTLARARDARALDGEEATILLQARGDDLRTLLSYASRTRDAGLAAAGRPGIITYSRKVFIPLTRLCRDRCGYCTFATVPHRLHSLYLEPDEVLDIARAGAAVGCKEALFTLGDKPEDRWHQAQDWLDAHGYDDTLSYLRAMAIRVLEETGLLPHLNPGVLSWQDFQRLKPVAPSMGMMLETTSTRLFSEKGGPHFGSPDKDPATRLRVLEDAGRSNVPFTTGILIGIGERMAERADSIFAIRKVAREYAGYLEQHGAATVTAEHAIAWAQLPQGVHPVTWTHRLSAVRGFATWLRTVDPATEIPPKGVFPGQGKRPAPFIFTSEDLAAVVAGCAVLRPAMRAAACTALFGLIAVTGIRIGAEIGRGSC